MHSSNSRVGQRRTARQSDKLRTRVSTTRTLICIAIEPFSAHHRETQRREKNTGPDICHPRIFIPQVPRHSESSRRWWKGFKESHNDDDEGAGRLWSPADAKSALLSFVFDDAARSLENTHNFVKVANTYTRSVWQGWIKQSANVTAHASFCPGFFELRLCLTHRSLRSKVAASLRTRSRQSQQL